MPDAPKMLVTICYQRGLIDQAKQAQASMAITSLEPLIAKIVTAALPFVHKPPPDFENWCKDQLSWRRLPPSIDQEDQQIDWNKMYTNGIFHDLFLTLYIKDDAGAQSLLRLVPLAWPLCKALEKIPNNWKKGVSESVLATVISCHRSLRAMVGILSPIPGACGCTPEDVQWLFPLEVEYTPQKKSRRAVAPDGLSEAGADDSEKSDGHIFGDFTETCRQVVRHMQRTKAWLDFREAYVSTHGVDKVWRQKLDQQITTLNNLFSEGVGDSSLALQQELGTAGKLLIEANDALRGPPLFPDRGAVELEELIITIVSAEFKQATAMHTDKTLAPTEFNKQLKLFQAVLMGCLYRNKTRASTLHASISTALSTSQTESNVRMWEVATDGAIRFNTPETVQALTTALAANVDMESGSLV